MAHSVEILLYLYLFVILFSTLNSYYLKQTLLRLEANRLQLEV